MRARVLSSCLAAAALAAGTLAVAGPASAAATGSISGSISGAPSVCAFAIQGTQVAGFQCPDADGQYEIDGLAPGDYQVGFVDLSVGDPGAAGDGYESQWYGGGTSISTAETVTVPSDGGNVGDIDATPVAGKQVVGQVGDKSTKKLLTSDPMSCFWLYPASGKADTAAEFVNQAWQGRPVESYTCTVSSTAKVPGRYAFRAVTAGSYKIFYLNSARGGLYADTWNGGASRTTASVYQVGSDQSTVTATTAYFARTGAITGKVVSATSGKPLSGNYFYVAVYNSTGSKALGYDSFVGDDGVYTLGQLKTGTYTVKFTANPPFKSQWYPKGNSAAKATKIKVTYGKIATLTTVKLSK